MVDVRESLEPADDLWLLYSRAFDDLRVKAVQRHVLLRSEFDAVMRDRRVLKLSGTDPDGTLRALATMTRDLAAVPLVSPDYFAHRWPEHFAAGRLWYVGFVAVDPAAQRGGLMGALIGRMVERIGPEGGAIFVDICCSRETTHRLSTAIESAASRFDARVARRELDAQLYYGYEFPPSAAS